jgi:hypothetical protein
MPLQTCQQTVTITQILAYVHIEVDMLHDWCATQRSHADTLWSSPEMLSHALASELLDLTQYHWHTHTPALIFCLEERP